MKKIRSFATIVGTILTIRFAEELSCTLSKVIRGIFRKKLERVRVHVKVRSFRRDLDENLGRLLLQADAEKQGFGRTYRDIKGLIVTEKR